MRLAARERLALLCVAATPVVVLPGGFNRFALPKAALAAAGVLCAALVPAASRRGSVSRVAAGVLGGGALLLLLAALLGNQPRLALAGAAPRFEGVLVLGVYAGCVAAGAWLLGPRRPAEHDAWLAGCVSVAAVLVAAVAGLEQVGVDVLSSDAARPGSLLGNASAAGAFGVLALGWLGGYLLHGRVQGVHARSKQVALTSAGAVAAAIVVVLSGSRGALVGAVVVAGCLLVPSAGRSPRWLAVVGVGVIAVGVFAVPATRDRVLGNDSAASASASGRAQLLRESVSLSAAHPLLGVGPSGFADAVWSEHTRRWARTVGDLNPPDSPHSVLLQATSAGGAPLLVLLGWLALLALRGVRRHPAAAVACAGYGATLLFSFTGPGETPLACLLLGALIAAPPGGSSDGLRWAAPAAASVATLVLLLGAVAEWPLQRAFVAASRADAPAADRLFTAAHQLRPWDADLATAAGHALDVLAEQQTPGAAAAADSWLRRARAARPRDPLVLLDLATLAEVRGDYASAVGLLATARKLAPLSPTVALRQGVAAAESREPIRAESLFREAAVLAPGSPAPWDDLAMLFTEQGRATEAAAAKAKADSLRAGR